MENNNNTEVMPEGTGAPAEINTAAQDNTNAKAVAAAVESNPAAVPTQPAELSDEVKFKKLLEHLVAHVEWRMNRDVEYKGFNEYINLNFLKKLTIFATS